MSDLQYTLGIDSRDGEQSLGRTGKAAQGLGGILAGLGAAAFAGSFLQRGFQFNQTMRDSEAAIGKVISQFQGLNDEAAKGAAAKAMQQLIALEPKAAGSLSTLVDGFLSTLAASQAAGLSVQQNIDLVGRFANAMANANIPTEQLGQEMRSIVTGNIGADSSLARILGITNEMVAAARESGNTYEFLASKIGKLGEAGDTGAVAFSSLSSAVDKAAGALASGLYDAALDGSKNLTTELEANIEAFVNLGRAIGTAATELVKFAGFASEALTAAARLAAISGMMLGDGLSYAEAAEAIDAVTSAREAEVAAAAAQAEAAKKVGAAVEASSQKEKAALDAAAAARKATDSAGLTDKGKPAAPGRASATEDPFAAAEQQIEAEKRLADLKRSAAMEQMTTGQKLGILSAELSAAAAEEAALRSDPFGGGKEALIAAETRRVEIQREINQLKRIEAAESQRGAANSAAATSAATNAPAPQAQPPAPKEKEKDERYDADDRRLTDGRKKIRGVKTPDTYTGGSLVTGNRSLAGPDGGMRGGLAAFDRKQQTSLGDDIKARQKGGPLDRFNAKQKTSLGDDIRAQQERGPLAQFLANQGPRVPAPDIAGRAQAATAASTAPAPAGGGKEGQSPELAKLDAIHAELLRIRTA